MFRRKPVTPDLPPEWMIVGLGNPGAQYSGTRHNVGFEVVERLADRARIKLDQRKHQAVFGVGRVGEATMLLVKPLTFMNLSGQAVSALARAYSLPPERIVVVTDEMDLPPGRLRMRPHGGAGGHNGHRSIIQSLGTDQYPRIRIGIGKPSSEGREHVLSGFRPEERKLVESGYDVIFDAIEELANTTLARAVTFVNEKSPV